MKRILTLTLSLFGITMLVPSQISAQATGSGLTIVRASAPGTGNTESHSISSDCNFVAFSSASSDLGISDTNGAKDVFVRDLTTNALDCVSKSSGGTLGTYDSINPSISTDGRYVAFQSLANNLETPDTNGSSLLSDGEDIFVYDRTLATIKRVSIRVNGSHTNRASQNPSISGDGAFVAFASQDTGLAGATASGADWYIYVVNTANAGTSGSVALVPVPDAPIHAIKKCLNPAISADGNFVAFEFDVDDTYGAPAFHYRDVYVYNRLTGQSTRLTGDSITDGSDWDEKISQNPSISATGTSVAFESNVILTSDSAETEGYNVFVAKIGASVTFRLASIDSLGNVGASDSTQPAISSNGRFVAFQSLSSNFTGGATNGDFHVYGKDLSTGKLWLLESQDSDGDSYAPSVSDDGSRVSFLSDATNLDFSDINGATDVYVTTLPDGPAVLAFDDASSATSIVDVTGSYAGRFPSSDNDYVADTAMDESGKIVAMGTLEDYSNPRGNQLRLTGSLKTVNSTPTVVGSGSVSGSTLDGQAVAGSGKVSVPLEESPTADGAEFPGAVASGSARRDGEKFKQPSVMVSVPAQSENISKDWSLALSVYERTDSKGRPYLAAFSTLYLPNGERTKFAEKKLTFSKKTSLYSITFASGIKINQALDPILNAKGKPVVDRKSKVTITSLSVEPTGEPREPTAGALKYQFLGQKGAGNLLDFF